MDYPIAPRRPPEQSSAPSGTGFGTSAGEPAFLSRRERREFEQAQAERAQGEQLRVEQALAPADLALRSHDTAPAAAPSAHASPAATSSFDERGVESVGPESPAPAAVTAAPVLVEQQRTAPSPFDSLFADLQQSEPHVVEARGTDVRTDDQRTIDSRDTETRRSHNAGRAHRVQPVEASTQTGRVRVQPNRAAAASARTKSLSAATAPRRKRRPLSKLVAKATIMLAAVGMVATTAVPAYAQLDSPAVVQVTAGRAQAIAVGAVQQGAIEQTGFTSQAPSGALDSTLNNYVPSTVQKLAQQLMSAVAAGRLTGSTPDHIFEIQYLAQGRAVPGCGVDYRVLQTIAFALTQFNSVGVSDINRFCTGQIEGAGTASAHYTDGGGHAVDFFRLNGQALSGGDSESIALIDALDLVVPEDATVGQEECRSSLALSHFRQIDDTCNHVHIDFGEAQGAALDY